MLFGENLYSTITGNPSITGQTNGRIGINVVNPTVAFEVSGDTKLLNTATIEGTLTLNSVDAGSGTDEVLVIDGGEVKKIDASSLGEDNNSLVISGVSSTVTLDENYYVVLGDTTGGAFTINLPPTPLTGQAYIIKDSAGNALTENITVNGNGKTIGGRRNQ